METEVKKGKFGKSVLWAVLSYVVISVIAGVISVVRSTALGEETMQVTAWMVLEVFLFPVLFVIAGYMGSKKYEFEKFKTYKVWFFSAGASAVLLLLWYVLLNGYVVLNLPVAEGFRAIDLFLRKITVVQDYEIKYLSQTDLYRYLVLPLLHFLLRIVYGLFYGLGNRMYATKQEETKRAKRRKR